MSEQARELLEVLIALSPYVVFIALIAWSAVKELRELKATSVERSDLGGERDRRGTRQAIGS